MSAFDESVEPFVIVIIGAGGDLGRRKLLPALTELHEQGWFPSDFRVIATSRKESVDGMVERLLEHSPVSEQCKREFASKVTCVGGYDPGDGGEKIANAIKDLPYKRRLFYAATPPDLFPKIALSIAESGLLLDDSPLVLEKPIGSGLESYLSINRSVTEHVPEHLIYRIDHYLGKETVQNLLCLRFANLMFESIWNRNYVDHVQITVAEKTGVEGRSEYYDTSGALRDMVQNHLAQLLCLTAMEPPRLYDADCVRDEKLKVLQSLVPITGDDLAFGQFGSGLVDGEKVASYREDVGQSKSKTESFVAMRVRIDNWRWAGVPFYLRTGKRMPVRESIIVIRFKAVPHRIFTDGGVPYNQIVIRLQPNEGVELLLNNKIPGPGGLRLEPLELNLNFSDSGRRLPDAYERLLLDALRNNPTLFMRHDEVEASWKWIESAQEARSSTEVEKYSAGTWGPDGSQLMMAADGRRWFNRGEAK